MLIMSLSSPLAMPSTSSLPLAGLVFLVVKVGELSVGPPQHAPLQKGHLLRDAPNLIYGH